MRKFEFTFGNQEKMTYQSIGKRTVSPLISSFSDKNFSNVFSWNFGLRNEFWMTKKSYVFAVYSGLFHHKDVYIHLSCSILGVLRQNSPQMVIVEGDEHDTKVLLNKKIYF